MLDKWQKKEKPVFTGITRGLGGFGFGGGGGDATPSAQGTATGGTTTTGGSYNYHVFLTSTPAPTRKFTVSGASMTVDYLVIAGGGSGGAYVPSGTIPGQPGTNSQFAISGQPYRETTAAGGGGGNSHYGAAPNSPGGSGGSGGGGGGGGTYRFGGTGSQYPVNPDTPAPFKNQPTVDGSDGMTQGRDAGDSNGVDGGSGGGGAGNSSSDSGGGVTAGGEGLPAFDGDTNLPSSYGTPGPVSNARYFAAGGGGGSRPAGAPGQPVGGGGAGGGSADGTPGTANTGSGGGGGENGVGAGHGGGGAGGFLQRFSKTIPVGEHPITVGSGAPAQNPNAGAGADGIVIIRYQ